VTRTLAPGNGWRRRADRSIRGMTGNSGSSRPAELLPGWGRWVALAVFAAFIAIGLALMNPSPPAAVAAAVVAVGAGALLVRGWRPLLLYAAVATAGVAVLGHGTSASVGWFAICLLAVWCVLIGGRRDGLVYLTGTLALFAVEWLWVEPDPGWGAWMAGTTFAVLGALLIRHDRELVSQLRAAQAGLAERARAEERNRIARELHDVIAHTLTVSLLHVTSARLAVEHDPADAARALAEAERLGQESLAEVRLAVGMLHRNDDPGRTAPLPGAGDLPALVERFRSAGADVTLAVEGDTGRLPATTGLAVYRILQEALTNAVKHAPGSPTAVRLGVHADAVRLAVDSAAEPGTGTGLGVPSMRERAEALGGSCQAGPGGRGWLVQAALPLAATRPRADAT
jgi:signal transduction histidine kinase